MTDYELYIAQLLQLTDVKVMSSVAEAQIFDKLLIYITTTFERNIYYGKDVICGYPLQDLRPTSCSDRTHTPKLRRPQDLWLNILKRSYSQAVVIRAVWNRDWKHDHITITPIESYEDLRKIVSRETKCVTFQVRIIAHGNDNSDSFFGWSMSHILMPL